MNGNQPFGHVDGFKVGQDILFVESSNDARHIRKQFTGTLGKIHPPQLDIS